ncbi:MAG TPA: AAA family ATPase [Acidimicrobiia bacterium]|jgi:class 3 adenylate cyclase/tetratricopeptide (TPR) repeat protein
MACPVCATENPDGAKFCLNCGARLEQAPDARRERKYVAILFADLVGSTTMGEIEDPEVVQTLISRAFERLVAEVERHGGTIDKIMGDGILALFGVPASHEDDAERAVRAGLAMQDALSSLNGELAGEGRSELQMRIGVESGEVLVYLERPEHLPDRMVTGDSANTAARLQAAAEPGTVVVGPGGYAATRQAIAYEELLPLRLKGKSEAVPAWRAKSVGGAQGERPKLGLESSLVGRDEELEMLAAALEEVSADRRPGLVTVIGPAGVGKSRLAAEFRLQAQATRTVRWLRGRALPYGNHPYSALRDAIRDHCGVFEDDDGAVLRTKVELAVAAVEGEAEIVEALVTLLGGEGSGLQAHEDLFEGWRSFLELLTGPDVLVITLEDIHWADEGLLDFVSYEAAWGDKPILMLTLARPDLLDRRREWGAGGGYIQLELDPLTKGESREMLSGLLGGDIDSELAELIEARSEGNPLFTEEIVRSLIDQGVLRPQSAHAWRVAAPLQELQLPTSVRGVIASRLDALPDRYLAVLRAAAVIGRVFWEGALAHITGEPSDELAVILAKLGVKDLIAAREPPSFEGESEFAFHHALIRDVAYEVLPKADRARLHALVGQWAEMRMAASGEENPELAATHYSSASEYLEELGEASTRREDIDSETVRWAAAAAGRATRVGSLADASLWLGRALELARPGIASPAVIASLWEQSGDVGMRSGLLDEALDRFVKAESLFMEAHMPADAARARARRARPLFELGRGEEAFELAKDAADELERLGSEPDLAYIAWQFGSLLTNLGRGEEAVPWLLKAADLGERWGQLDALAGARVNLGMLTMWGGDWEGGKTLLEAGASLSRQVGDLDLFFTAEQMLIWGEYGAGPVLDMEQLQSKVQAAIQLAQKGGRVQGEGVMRDAAGWIAFMSGQFDVAEAHYEFMRSFAEVGYTGWLPETLKIMALIAGLQGRTAELIALSTEAKELGAEIWEGSIRTAWTEAMIAYSEERYEDSASILSEAAEQMPEGPSLDTWDLLLAEAVDALAMVGRRDEAAEFARTLRSMADGRPAITPLADWTEGLVTDGDQAIASLKAAADGFETRCMPVYRARALIDLSRVQAASGGDPEAARAEASALLEETGAFLFMPELNRVS